MRAKPQPWQLRFATAVLAAALAQCLVFLTASLATPDPLLLFLIATIAAGWYGGHGPGLVAAVLSALAMHFFVRRQEPASRELLAVVGELILFPVVSLMVSTLASAWRRAERDVAIQRNLLQSLCEASPDGILLVSETGRTAYFNTRFADLWGIPQDVLATGRDEAVLAIARSKLTDPDAFMAKVAHLYRHLDEESHDELTLADGRTLERYSAPVHGPDRSSHHRVWFFRDITDRKRGEAELREAHDQLERRVQDRTAELARVNEGLQAQIAVRRRTEKMLRSVTARARCILWIADVHGLPGWEDASSVQDAFRWSIVVHDVQAAQKVVPLHVPDTQRYVDVLAAHRNPDDQLRCDHNAAAAFREGRGDYSHEFRVTDQDNQEHWLFEDVHIETRGDGRWHVVGVCTDITEQKLAEAERTKLLREQAARAEAEAANHAKDRLIAVLSHELRTPLNPVLTAVSALELRADLPADVRADLAMVRRNVQLETLLIDELLDLTRAAKGKLQLQRRPIDVHAKLHAALAICQDDIRQKRLEITFDLQADNPTVDADPARIQQVFWNLIKNAVKFTPAGGRISFHSSNPTPQTLRMTITDSGIGIAPDLLPRLFEAYEQGGQSITRQFGGLGLGLSICKTVIDAHGGTLTAHSDGPQKGATFAIELATTTSAPPQPGPILPAADDAQSRSLRILLVEDHADSARLLSRLLETMGHTVLAANTLQKATELAKEHDFDLLMSDLGLPDGSGLELMKRMLNDRRPIKGIALSGFGMESDVQKSREAGFAEHLTKPIDFPRLRAIIRALA